MSKLKYQIGESVWFSYFFIYTEENWLSKSLTQKFTIKNNMNYYTFKETTGGITFGANSSICNYGDPVYES